MLEVGQILFTKNSGMVANAIVLRIVPLFFGKETGYQIVTDLGNVCMLGLSQIRDYYDTLDPIKRFPVIEDPVLHLQRQIDNLQVALTMVAGN